MHPVPSLHNAAPRVPSFLIPLPGAPTERERVHGAILDFGAKASSQQVRSMCNMLAAIMVYHDQIPTEDFESLFKRIKSGEITKIAGDEADLTFASALSALEAIHEIDANTKVVSDLAYAEDPDNVIETMAGDARTQLLTVIDEQLQGQMDMVRREMLMGARPIIEHYAKSLFSCQSWRVVVNAIISGKWLTVPDFASEIDDRYLTALQRDPNVAKLIDAKVDWTKEFGRVQPALRSASEGEVTMVVRKRLALKHFLEGQIRMCKDMDRKALLQHERDLVDRHFIQSSVLDKRYDVARRLAKGDMTKGQYACTVPAALRHSEDIRTAAFAEESRDREPMTGKQADQATVDRNKRWRRY